MDKYYFEKVAYRPDRIESESIIRFNPLFTVTIEENVEVPSFKIDLTKDKANKNPSPKSNEYIKYKSIGEDMFASYFHHGIRNIKAVKWDLAEYYLEKSNTNFDFSLFTPTNKQQRIHIHINIWDTIQEFQASFYVDSSFTRKQSITRRATRIPENIFVSALNETLAFFEDQNSYLINHDSFLKKIHEIVNGNLKVAGEVSGGLKNTNDVINQLEVKREDIINRLVSNDNDTELIRAGLRGEKEGIEYALRTLKKFFRLNP